MSNKAMVVWGIVVALLLIGLIAFSSIVGFRYECVKFNRTISAQVTDMKAKYNEYFTKLKEAAQVPEQQMKKLKEFYDAIVAGRSSEGAMFKFIQENNPNINQDTFVELQRIIVAGRADIYDIQKVHIDTVREYNTYIMTFPNNWINKIFKYKSAVATVPVAGNVEEIFKTGVDKPIQVF